MKATGSFLRHHRLRNNITQDKLSQHFKNIKGSQTISNIERGKSTLPIKMVVKMSKILKVGTDEFIKVMGEDYLSRLEDKLNDRERV